MDAEKSSILVVDDEQLMLDMIADAVRSEGINPKTASNVVKARSLIQPGAVDLVITDLNMPGESGLELIRHVRSISPQTCIIVVTAFPDNECIKQLEELEVSSFLIKPFTLKQLKYSMFAALETCRSTRRNASMDKQLVANNDMGLVGVSAYIQSVRRQILLFASGDFPVLIQGESGTGKEIIAHAIHTNSVRNGANLITINCAAIPWHLEESEFFGHAKGAFTGALTKKIGIIESADDSTLFLDEIGELSLGVQAKLLRVLDTGEYTRIGETAVQHADIRIISATNRDLEDMVSAGTFRKDLYFRVKAAAITTQPLAGHSDDIPCLMRHFINALGSKKEISADALELLCCHPWPGNIRELKHATHMLCNASKTQRRINSAAVRSVLNIEETGKPVRRFADAKKAFEHDYFTALLRKHNGNLTRVAADAGLHRPNLIRKIKELDISPDAFRRL